MFPSYYFDYYEEIILGEKEENSIKKILNKIELFEDFLRDIYNYLNTKIVMPEIDWLRNNF